MLSINIVDIVILVILGISVVYGLYRGFIHTLLSVGCCLLSVLLALSFGPQLAGVLRGNEGVTTTLATYTDAVSRVGDYDLASMAVSGLGEGTISEILQKVQLPESISNILKTNLESGTMASAGLNSVNDYVSNTIVSVAVNILCFILCYAVAYMLLSVIVSLIQHVFRFPILKQLDWVAGGVFGFVRGALILYVLFLTVPVLITVIPIDGFSELVESSALAGFFQSDGFFAGVIAGHL